jgi:hypothetical protein
MYVAYMKKWKMKNIFTQKSLNSEYEFKLMVVDESL